MDGKSMKLLVIIIINIIFLIVLLNVSIAEHKCPLSHSKEKMHCPIMVKGADIKVNKIEKGMIITITSDNEDIIKRIKEEAKKHQEEVSKKHSLYVCSVNSDDCNNSCPCLIEGSEMKVIEKSKGVDIEITSEIKEVVDDIYKKAEEIMKYTQNNNKS